MKIDTLKPYQATGSQGLGHKLDLKQLNLTQGAIYGWWKVNNHLHTD